MVNEHKKLKESVLYISQVAEPDDTFAKVKLCKLLYNIDFEAYLQFGKSVTEETYRKLEQGTVPTAVFSLLEDDKDVVLVNRLFHGYTQQKPVAMRDAETSIFTVEEIALINLVVRRHWGQTGTQMSNESHNFIGWRLAKDNEIIPLQAALLEDRDLTESEKLYAKQFDMSAV